MDEEDESKTVGSILPKISSYYKKNQEKEIAVPAEDHTLIYESVSETLEPLYFWLLDYMDNNYKPVEKLVDNFTSSPGSGHFSELMGKATRMQEEAMKIMQTLGILVKSIINIIYDLREFQIRLAHYKSLRSKSKEEVEAAKLALKQIWLDQVDIKKGNTSIKGMASQYQYVTLIDAFMAAETIEAVKGTSGAAGLDLNERVKRILLARLAEYLEWEKRSEKELLKRYKIEIAYLRSQVNSLKLYTKWVKPYLIANNQLKQSSSLNNPELVTAFNTVYLQVALFGREEIKLNEIDKAADYGIPESFRNKEMKRKYYACLLLDFKFRGIPQRAGQHYVFGGRATVGFKAYAVNNEEYEKLKQEIEDQDMKDALELAQGMTDESLEQIKEDIEEFLGEEEAEKITSSNSEDIDPFTALIKGSEPKKEDKKKKEDKIKPDSYVEKVVREFAVKEARRKCFKAFDTYKKIHGMPSHDDPYEQPWIPTEDAGWKI